LKVNGYTLNLLKSRTDLPKVKSFQDWLFEELEANA
jgi:LysR family transcriptional regulator, glycine cleavage system transcriptional activator